MKTPAISYQYLITLIMLPCIFANEIIISPEGGDFWQGNCLQTCTSAAPCRLMETAINSGSDGPCEVTFLGGQYPHQINHTWIYPSSAYITLLYSRNISNLNFLVNLGSGILEMTAADGIFGELFVSRIEFEVGNGFPVYVSRLIFRNSMLIRRGSGQQVEIKFCLFSSYALSAGFLSTVPDHLNLTIDRVEFQYFPNAPPSSALVRVGSTVSMRFEGFGFGTTLLHLSYEVVPSSSLTIVNSDLDETKIVNDEGGNTLAKLSIRSSTVVSSFKSTVRAYEMQIANNIEIQGYTFISPNVTLTSSLLRSSTITARSVTNDDGGQISIGGLVQMHPDCSLTTDDLRLNSSSSLEIESLTVFRSITSGTTPAAITAMPASVSVWDFSSILVENTYLDAKNLSELHYRATVPARGIVLTGSSSLHAQPDVVIVSWHSPNDPNVGVWYPLANQMIGRPDSLRAGSSLASRRLEIFSQIDAGLLQYKLLPEACPPPPVGFKCVLGVWVADGTGNTTTVVVIPGNGGVVKVDGNLTVSGPIVFEGTGSSLNVSGCVDLTSVDIEIDPSQEVPSTPMVLIQQGKNCPNSLGDAFLRVKQSSESCKKVSVKHAPSPSDSLLVVFSVDSSGCSTWIWIVVGSVIGVIVVTAVVAVVIWRVMKTKYSRR